MNEIKSVLQIEKIFINYFSEIANNNPVICVDCTVGNGNDLKFLIEKFGENGIYYGFDIQIEAINKTKTNLSNIISTNHKIYLINDNHKNLDLHINNNIDLCLFNLGFLPGGNKNITTKNEDTIIAIEKSMNKLSKNGLIFIVFYPGHKEGKEEYDFIKPYLENIDQKKFNIFETHFINQINNPPKLIVIQKR